MFRQIRYFQSVVETHSFSKAAEECHISQSAISQQIKALETELGFDLLNRHNRTFELTPAGEYFYKKSLILISDYEQIHREALRIAQGDRACITIGYPRDYGQREIRQALAQFSRLYPKESVQFITGNHEELFEGMRNDQLDLVLNDQRRAFSKEYVNRVVQRVGVQIELSADNALTALDQITCEDVKDYPCILVSSPSQQSIEEEYYRTVIGFKGEFIFANTLEEARLMVVSNQGFLPTEQKNNDPSICQIPLVRHHRQVEKTYCLFWKEENSGYFIEIFADLLQNQFK